MAGAAVAAQIGPRPADQRPVAAPVGRADLLGPLLRGLQFGLGQIAAQIPRQHAVELRTELGNRAARLHGPASGRSPAGRGGGQISHSPRRSASSSNSGAGRRCSQTALNPIFFNTSSGSPRCWMIRGNIGRPSTSSTDPTSFTVCRGEPRRRHCRTGGRRTDGKTASGRVARGGAEMVASRRRRRLPRLRGHVAGHIEIVDPDVGRARPAVDVQQHGIEVGFAIVHLRSKLHPQEVDLPGQQAGDLLDPQLLPAADVGVAAAGDDRRHGPARAGIDRSRQNDPGGQLHARPVRLDPHAGHQFVDDPRPADVVGEIDVRAAVGLHVAATRSRCRCGRRPGAADAQRRGIGHRRRRPARTARRPSKPSCHAGCATAPRRGSHGPEGQQHGGDTVVGAEAGICCRIATIPKSQSHFDVSSACIRICE